MSPTAKDETNAVELNEDPAFEALNDLAEATTSSIRDLHNVNQDIATMQSRRRHGWSWRRIVATEPSLLSEVSNVAAMLARAAGKFRRALVLVLLRREGLRTTEVGRMLDVSRQRVSALLKPRREVPGG